MLKATIVYRGNMPERRY